MKRSKFKRLLDRKKRLFGKKIRLEGTAHKQNVCAILIALGAFTVLHFSYDPQPAGASPGEVPIDLSAMQSSSGTDIPENTSAGNNENEVSGRMAILMQILLLEKGLDRISEVPSYSATFCKQEKLGGVLSEPSFMQVKIRHEPFSVYAKQIEGSDVGQEILYVDGQNNNEMMVKLGGVKGRMMPALNLDPHGSIAMQESRYPITNLGVKPMIEKIIEVRQSDLKNSKNLSCRMIDNQRFNKRPCYCFIMEYKVERPDFPLRKSLIYIDKEMNTPACVKNFSYPPDGQEGLTGKELDEKTLVEFYSISNINFDQQFVDIDFDKANTNYSFRR